MYKDKIASRIVPKQSLRFKEKLQQHLFRHIEQTETNLHVTQLQSPLGQKLTIYNITKSEGQLTTHLFCASIGASPLDLYDREWLLSLRAANLNELRALQCHIVLVATCRVRKDGTAAIAVDCLSPF